MATVNISAMAKTWNDAGTTFTAIGLDVTDTASNAASLLMDLKVGGASVFSIDKAGKQTTIFSGIYNAEKWLYGEDGYGAFSISPFSAALVFSPPAANGAIKAGVSFDGYLFSVAGIRIGSTTGGNLRIEKDADDVLAQRRTTNAQTNRVYGTYTDASNYERLAITRDAITVESAGTGTANIDLALTPAGTGVLKFGSHTALGGESVSGYITIKDAGGTPRKIAVVS